MFEKMKEIVINVGSYHTKIVLFENKKLIEYHIEESDNKKILGNIYVGKVKDLVKGMQAAFVDIGVGKNGYLYLNEDKLKTIKQGQDILVQIKKEEVSTKGVFLTSDIVITGKHIVLMPLQDEICISAKIIETEERQRLTQIIKNIKPENVGFIVRTDAKDKDRELLEKEVQELIQQWENIVRRKDYVKSPYLIYEGMSTILTYIRDLFRADIDKIVVNNEIEYKNIIEFVSSFSENLKDKVVLMDKEDISLHYKLESQVDKALQNYVWLKSGAKLIIQSTEAMHVIDVNTGKFTGKKELEDTILKTNIEAAEEVARQIRLRNLSGIIIIDFIDMKKQESKDKVLEILKNEVKKDRIKTVVVGMTRLGLVEMTRQKTKKSLQDTLLTTCSCCNGTGLTISVESVVEKIEEEINYIIKHTIYKHVILEVNEQVAKKLVNKNSNYIKLTKEAKDVQILLKSNKELDLKEYKIETSK